MLAPRPTLNVSEPVLVWYILLPLVLRLFRHGDIFQLSVGLTLNNKAYSTGTTPNVSKVENNRPAIIAIAIGSHISPPPRYIGIKPSTVVAVVSNIGRKRF